MSMATRGGNRWGKLHLLFVVVCLVFGVAMSASLPGCGGCSRKTAAQRKKEADEKAARKEEEQRKKDKEKPKKDFELPVPKRSMALPTDHPVSTNRSARTYYKPGHWTATVMTAKANNFDFPGNLEIVSTDRKQKRLPLPGTPFFFGTSRQAILSKGRWKAFESAMFIPQCDSVTDLSCRLSYRKGGRRAFHCWDEAVKMPSYQYHFIVLARSPLRYLYLQGLDSIEPRADELTGGRNDPHYRMSLIKSGTRAPLPSHSQFWTSTAYVLWDDAEPTTLDPEQQQAMINWLHWGGQLILSGPDTLDTLKGSFLAPYLPATAALGGRKIDAVDFEPFAQWSEAGKSNGTTLGTLRLSKPWTGIELQPHAQARFVPGSGGLAVERRVGAGRVVASAFRLDSSALKMIPGGDEFFNAILMRRPSRKFVVHEFAVSDDSYPAYPGSNDPETTPSDTVVLEEEIEVCWSHSRANRLDARSTTQVRYFSRDTDAAFSDYAEDTHFDIIESSAQIPCSPGLAAWDDFNTVSNDARHALKKAAEIEIPKPDFVIWVVVAYLLVLVPANWLVFRAINRVEWAWVAAPVIAVVCTFIVIHLAQLDIGFARSRTEIAVLELQSDYDRAHVTRYTALYTSLGTRYNFELEDPGAAVLPFPRDAEGKFKMAFGQKRRELVMHRGEHVRLEKFPVTSNDTDFVHSEQMLDLDGPLVLAEDADGRQRVTNRTQFPIREASVVHRDKSGKGLKVAWLGTLEPGDSKTIDWDWEDGTDILGVHRRGSILMGRTPPSSELSLGALVKLAETERENLRPGEMENLRPGETRLVGLIEEEIPGMKVRPAAPQTRCATLVVAHLGFGYGEDPQPDVNTPAHPQKVSSQNSY